MRANTGLSESETATTGGAVQWTEELYKRAAAMAMNGASAREVANAIGKTRSAVISKLSRRGVRFLGTANSSKWTLADKWKQAGKPRPCQPYSPNVPSARLLGCEAWLPARHKAPPRDVDAMDLTAPHRYAAPNMERPLRPLEREAKRFFARTGWTHIGNGRWRRSEPTPAFAASGWLS